LCNYISGIPELRANSIEQQRTNINNIYKPLWVPINKINNLTLYPLEIKDLFLHDIKNGFSFTVQEINIDHFDLKQL
jgi:hypothetical protein